MPLKCILEWYKVTLVCYWYPWAKRGVTKIKTNEGEISYPITFKLFDDCIFMINCINTYCMFIIIHLASGYISVGNLGAGNYTAANPFNGGNTKLFHWSTPLVFRIYSESWNSEYICKWSTIEFHLYHYGRKSGNTLHKIIYGFPPLKKSMEFRPYSTGIINMFFHLFIESWITGYIHL